jgi:hypothetical protein
MEKNYERQYRHEKLIDCLMMFAHYNSQNDKNRLRKRKTHLTEEKLAELNEMELNAAIAVLHDVLNLCSHLCEDLKLDKLLTNYLKFPDKRKEIKAIFDKVV